MDDSENYDIVADLVEDELQPQPHILCDMNYLHESFRRSMVGSDWKEEPQRFETDVIYQLAKISDSLANHTYKTDPTTEFVLNERGKCRYIHGNTIKDRIVRHNLCDNIITPAINNLLIYNNGASQKDKGISFSRKQFETDLHNFYLCYGDIDGYILFGDFSKYYDNVRHDKTREMFEDKLDVKSKWLFNLIVDSFNIDITNYPMINPNEKFDSIAFHQLLEVVVENAEPRFLNKGIDIGDQTAQNIGVFYPTRIDTYATVVRHHKWYGRYMDDFYIIHRDVEYLKETLKGIQTIADELGIFINDKKTHIYKLSDTYKFLQIKYFMTETGKVVKRINPTSLTRERRKLKAYKRLLDKGDMKLEDIRNAYKSWIGDYYKIMSKEQIKNTQSLYTELFKEKVRYKK